MRRPHLLAAALLTATLLAAAGAWLWPLDHNPLLVRLFGPPAVTLREAYGAGGSASVDHARYDALLRRVVTADGRVDYAALATAAGELDAYLDTLAAAPFDALGRDAKLALLLNAYNAFTLKLILDRRPLASIKDIPAGERWSAKRWRLAGEIVSLDHIEHDAVRRHFADPRIHFALNCASDGCPPLRAEAYVGARLDAQLEDQARRVHGDPRWLHVEGDTVRLTPLYLWYRGDFEQAAGSVLAYAAQWAPVRPDMEIEWLDYDWALNAAR